MLNDYKKDYPIHSIQQQFPATVREFSPFDTRNFINGSMKITEHRAPSTIYNTDTTRAVIGWNYGAGRVLSFTNAGGQDDFNYSIYNTLFKNAIKWVTKKPSRINVLVLHSEKDTNIDYLKQCILSIPETYVRVFNDRWTNFTGDSLLGVDLVILASHLEWIQGEDMSVTGQMSLVNFIKAGGSMITVELILWLTGNNKLSILADVLPAIPTSRRTARTKLYYKKTNQKPTNIYTDVSVLYAGLPEEFTWTPSVIEGTETYIIEPKPTSISFYDSIPPIS